MAASEWGMCKDCQWWQIDPDANRTNTTMGLCIEHALQPFRLRVSGNSGCNHFTPGQPAHAAGSSAALQQRGRNAERRAQVATAAAQVAAQGSRR